MNMYVFFFCIKILNILYLIVVYRKISPKKKKNLFLYIYQMDQSNKKKNSINLSYIIYIQTL